MLKINILCVGLEGGVKMKGDWILRSFKMDADHETALFSMLNGLVGNLFLFFCTF
jgi:hypothetical protein